MNTSFETRIKLLELFAGNRSVGKVGEMLGMKVFSVDWGAYIGIDLCIDIGNMQANDVPFIPNIVWASPDCTTYQLLHAQHIEQTALNQKLNTLKSVIR